MRSLLAKRLVDGISRDGIHTGLKSTFDFLENRIGGLAGCIGITRTGDYFYHYNTPKMAYGFVTEAGEARLHIRRK
jgi:isoaspartyl peptidase/L-asparaginase-like protein (Ntn-hydrolase superfamily)